MKSDKLLRLLTLTFLLLSGPALAEDKFTVGVIQSTTGIAAEDGNTVIQSLKLARQKLSKAGHNIELLIEDDQTIPKKTLAAYQSLKDRKIDALVAATWDFTTNTIMPLVDRDKLVVFNTSTLPESIHNTSDSGYFFINSFSAVAEAEPFRAFLKTGTNKSLSILYTNNAWGESQKVAYEKIAAEQGVQVRALHSSVSFDENDWRQIIPALKAAQPELLVLLLNKSDLEIFLRRANEVGLKTRYFASKNAFDALRLSKFKDLYEGLCFTYPYEQLRGQAEFVSEYKRLYGEEPRVYADSSYDALFILAEAFRKSKAEKISLKDALQKTSFTGLVGQYTFSPDTSFSRGAATLMCVRSGSAEVEK